MKAKSKIGTSTMLSANGERRRTIGILSLGCPRNLVDSENVLGRLSMKGHSIVDIDKADIGIVNTCAFIEEAKHESIEAILDLIELKKEDKLKKIIVYGCLAQRYKDKLRRQLPEIDAIVGRVSLPAKLSKEQAGSRLVSNDWRENHDLERYPLTPLHYAYLKICEGCINNCSFCIIPKIKGKFTSLDFCSILRKVREFNEGGLSELNIVGQDITGFGIDLSGKPQLPRLLKKILKESGNLGWVRLLYLHPSRIDRDLLKLINQEPKLCKYIDLPIQHINERILKMMNRSTKKKNIIELIERIRKLIPGVGLRTSIICGFPSETEKEFKELLKFLKAVEFERLGAFIYSREEGTEAFNFKKQIPKKIKLERFNEIMSVQKEVSSEVNKRYNGKTLDVLIDEEERGVYLGRTQYDAPEVDGSVYVKSKVKLKPGDFVKVKINDTLEYDLVGEVVKK